MAHQNSSSFDLSSPFRGTGGNHLVVVGGGAAGFFCAVNAARLAPGLQVTILEKTGKLLSKVKISGGGRCNVTHAVFEVPALSKRYPRGQNFIKKTAHHFAPTDTIEWFRQRGVQIKREEDGRMFPVTDDSQTIIDCLLSEAQKLGVTVKTNTDVKSISKEDGLFYLQTSDSGRPVSESKPVVAQFVCIATGGYPKASMFEWLQTLGHTIAEPVPSLFTFNLPKHPITSLMGVTANFVRAKIAGSKLVEEGPVLITHWGLSGPAILRLSAWGARELAQKEYRFKVHLNWMPAFNEQTLKAELQQMRSMHPAKKIVNHNFTSLPSRLFQFLLQQSGITEEQRFADLPAKAENTLIRNLVDYIVEVQGKTTFKEEFVTAGGITLSEVDANTMESRKLPRLYFAGEVLDVDGITGGFNFQHAWSSGFIAAKAIAAQMAIGQ